MRYVLACILGGLAGPAAATLCSDPWEFGFYDDMPIIQPGGAGYDPAVYGQQLFSRFEWQVFSDERIVIIGQFERTSPDPFYSETLGYSPEPLEGEDPVVRPSQQTFTYSGAYVFSGLGIADGRTVEIRARPVYLVLTANDAVGFSGSLPRDGETYMVGVRSSDGIEIVLAPSGCPDHLAVPPDAAALDIFLTCVAQRGCP